MSTDSGNEKSYCEAAEIAVFGTVYASLGTKVFECSTGKTECWDVGKVCQECDVSVGTQRFECQGRKFESFVFGI